MSTTATPGPHELAAMLRGARAAGFPPASTHHGWIRFDEPRRRTMRSRITLLALFAAVAMMAGVSDNLAPENRREVSRFPHETRLRASLSPVVGRVRPHGHQQEDGMRRFFAFGVGCLVVSGPASSASAQHAVEWSVKEGGNGHWYQLVVHEPITWPNARTACEAHGGHLATPTSDAEHAFILSIANRAEHPNAWVDDFGGNSEGPWLGAYQPLKADPAQPWMWVTGEPWDWAGWAPGEPNGGYNPGESVSCMLGYAGSNEYRGWADAGLTDFPPYPLPPSYVVEWSADCNQDGIVDFGQIHAGDLVDVNANNIPDCCEQGLDCRFNAVEWRTEDGGNGHWYVMQLAGYPTTWESCREVAEGVGGHLATLTSADENSFVSAYAVRHPEGWSTGLGFGPVLGGYQPNPNGGPSSDWRWVTGEPWKFTAWATGEPNDHGSCGPGSDEPYLAFLTPALWNDVQDVTECFYGWLVPSAIIEWSADCNGDGLNDFGQIRAGELADMNVNNIPDCCEQGTSCIPCAADIDESGSVDAFDLAAVLSSWGTDGGKSPRTDIDGNGDVDAGDLAAVLSAWGPCP